MYDFEELDRMEMNESKQLVAKKLGFFAKLAYCWINVASIIR